ncbi:zinc metalloproteinase nas-13-like [Cloeon dipterum]|uniref:zinc metalloproteinase nas-13-like n=1 Tax=Cloeon dipterum TaxID=197152 RepID=UPI00322026D9
MEAKPQKGKNVVRSRSVNWPNAVVPYNLQPGMSSSYKRIVKSGMDWLMKGSCLKFRPRRAGDKDYLYILYDSAGCWSYIGRQGGGQAVSLQSNGCFEPGVVAHELLHAVGFLHEQSATNRDEYILVNFTNIERDKYAQFMKYNATLITDYNVGYDYDSLMHYSRKAFSKNGLDTIVPYQPGVEIGQRSHVSEKDLEKLNFKYCNKTVEAMEQTTQSSRPTTRPRPGTVVKPSGNNKPGTNTAGRPGGSGGNRPGNNAGGRPG